jgi:hypothetical protein
MAHSDRENILSMPINSHAQYELKWWNEKNAA